MNVTNGGTSYELNVVSISDKFNNDWEVTDNLGNTGSSYDYEHIKRRPPTIELRVKAMRNSSTFASPDDIKTLALSDSVTVINDNDHGLGKCWFVITDVQRLSLTANRESVDVIIRGVIVKWL